MSKSLTLMNGDLSTVGRSFDTVEGKDKLMQDLRLHIMERIGTDPATPGFGSRFETDAYIGNVYSDELEMEARAEILDIVENYQQGQLEKMKSEIVQFRGRHTLSNDEIIETIDGIDSAFAGSNLLIRVHLTTLAGTQLRVNVPVPGV